MDPGEVMAKVYYVKDGSYPRNFIDLGRRVSVEALEHRIQGQDLRYLSTLPPEFNREHPSHEVKYVIVELAMDELPGQRLTRTGYYLVPHLFESIQIWGLRRLSFTLLDREIGVPTAEYGR